MNNTSTVQTLTGKISIFVVAAAVVGMPFLSTTQSAQAAPINQNRNNRDYNRNNRNNRNDRNNRPAPANANRPSVNRPGFNQPNYNQPNYNQPNFNPRFDNRNDDRFNDDRNNRFNDRNNDRFNDNRDNRFNNRGYSGSINLTATVVDGSRNRPLTVQAGDGNNYEIAGYNSNSFRVGDRIQVQGTVKDATIQPSRVSRF